MTDRNASRPISALQSLLKDARFVRGLTLAEAGEQMGVAASTLMRWERGTSLPSLEQLCRAAQWLGVEVVLLPRATPRKKAAR